MPKTPDIQVRFIEPMLAKLVDTLPEGSGWQYEIKLDGYRAVVVKCGDHLDVFSRRGNKFNKRYPAIAAAFDRLAPNTVIDGEIVCLDARGRPDFSALQNWRPSQPMYFYAFDMMLHEGQDVTHLPLIERRRLLQLAIARVGEPARFSPTIESSVTDLIAAVRQQGFEGIVAKRRDSFYDPGKRAGSWLKFKTPQSRELIIGGYLPGPYVFDSLLVGHLEDGRLLFISKVRNGFTPTLRMHVAKHFTGLETSKCPFVNLPESRGPRFGMPLTEEAMKICKWLKPKLIAHFEFADWTRDNHLRHGRFVSLTGSSTGS